MVGRGHVASLWGCDPGCYPPPPARIATLAAVPIGPLSRW